MKNHPQVHFRPVRWFVIGLACVPVAGAATVGVDWLTIASGGSAAGFSLVDDSSAITATGKMVIQQGIAFPGLPAARPLADAFWGSDTGFDDSVSGDSLVSAFAFRVVPSAGAASYRIEFAVPSNQDLVLLVADLFHGAAGQTQSVILSAVSDSGSSVISFAGTQDWNSGVNALTQPVIWNPTTSTLSTSPTAEGDSTGAFFTIPALTGANAKLILDIPVGYASGVGDPITIGLGVRTVPETGGIALAAIGGSMLIFRRKMRG